MIGKFVALVAVMAAVVAADCGFLSTGIAGCQYNGVFGGRALTVGPSVTVASSFPSCSPVAVPSHVVDPIAPVAGCVTPVASCVTPVTSCVTPVTSCATPVTSCVTPVTSCATPVTSCVTPVTSCATPIASVVAPVASCVSPAAAVVSPVASVVGFGGCTSGVVSTVC